MRSLTPAIPVLLIFGAGYVLGTMNSSAERTVSATQDDVTSISEVSLGHLKDLNKAAIELSTTLRAEDRYKKVIEGENYFALSVGGVNAEKDLEEGRGVDPETFAALYADRGTPEIAEHIQIDDDGHLRYKGAIVRIYSRERLRELFNNRDLLATRASR